MKKIIIVLILSLFTCICSAEEITLFEGFDAIPWGTSFEEINKIYPNARNITLPNQKAVGEKVLSVTENGPTMSYYLFNDKLYKGRIYISDINHNAVIAVYSILCNTYGEPYGGNPIEGGDVWLKKKGYSSFWAPFEKLYISFKYVSTLDASNRLMGNELSIEYSDFETLHEVNEAKKKKE